MTEVGPLSSHVWMPPMSALWRIHISATVQRFSRLQVLVNTAGTADLGSAPGQAWHDFIDLFLRGPYYASHAVDEIQRAGGGSIVNVASIAGVTGSISVDVVGTGYGSANMD